jgi:hypothetical protein
MNARVIDLISMEEGGHQFQLDIVEIISPRHRKWVSLNHPKSQQLSSSIFHPVKSFISPKDARIRAITSALEVRATFVLSCSASRVEIEKGGVSRVNLASISSEFVTVVSVRTFLCMRTAMPMSHALGLARASCM